MLVKANIEHFELKDVTLPLVLGQLIESPTQKVREPNGDRFDIPWGKNDELNIFTFSNEYVRTAIKTLCTPAYNYEDLVERHLRKFKGNIKLPTTFSIHEGLSESLKSEYTHTRLNEMRIEKTKELVRNAGINITEDTLKRHKIFARQRLDAAQFLVDNSEDKMDEIPSILDLVHASWLGARRLVDVAASFGFEGRSPNVVHQEFKKLAMFDFADVLDLSPKASTDALFKLNIPYPKNLVSSVEEDKKMGFGK